LDLLVFEWLTVAVWRRDEFLAADGPMLLQEAMFRWGKEKASAGAEAWLKFKIETVAC